MRSAFDMSTLKKAVGNADGYDGDSVDVEVDRLLAIGRPIVTELEKHTQGRPCMIFNRTKGGSLCNCCTHPKLWIYR